MIREPSRMPGPDDNVGQPEFATVQLMPVPVPDPVSDPLNGLPVESPKPFDVFGAYWTPKSNPANCGERYTTLVLPYSLPLPARKKNGTAALFGTSEAILSPFCRLLVGRYWNVVTPLSNRLM